MEWRLSARIVGWVDFCFSLLGLLILIVMAALAGAVTSEAKKNPDVAVKVDPAVLWVIVGILALISFVQFWAVIQLIKGTNPERIEKDPEEAYKMVKNWRNVSMVFLILTLIGFIVLGFYVASGIFLVLRGTLFFIVHMFMKELQ